MSSAAASNWKAKRYQEAKIRSRQSLAKKQKENEGAKKVSTKGNVDKKAMQISGLSSLSKSSTHHYEIPLSKQTKTTMSIEPKKKSSFHTNNHDNNTTILKDIKNSQKEDRKSNVDTSHNCVDNAIHANSKISVSLSTTTQMKGIKGKDEIRKGEIIDTKEVHEKKRIMNHKIELQDTNENDGGDLKFEFTEFMNEMKREIKSDHVELLNSFQSILLSDHHKGENSTTIPSLDELKERKTKKIQLSIKTTTQLASINTTLRKSVRKSHFTNKSQVITDKQYYRGIEKNVSKSKKKDKKKISLEGKRVLDSSYSITSKLSSNSSFSEGRSREKNWKVTSIFSKRKNSVDNENEKYMKTKLANNKKGSIKESNPLPIVIDVATSNDIQSVIDIDNDEDDFHSVNSLSNSSSSSSPLLNMEPEKIATNPSNPLTTTTPHLSHCDNVPWKSKSKVGTRPPRPPILNPKVHESKKASFPAWLVALREKQKNKRREERNRQTFDDDDHDDDNRSVNTIDLENSAADAMGRQTVISIFGKTVPLRSYSKEPKRDVGNNDNEQSSPWKVQLKPVDRKSVMGNVPSQIRPPSDHTPNQYPFISHYSPLRSNNGSKGSSQKRVSPQQKAIDYNISPGDVVDLLNLPPPAFEEDEKTHMFSITNNSDNRNQVAVLGEKLLLIASKFTNTIATGKQSEKANILWFTPRSEITTLGLNNKADGVTITIKNGTSFPLNFESCNQCFSFVQTYYDRNKEPFAPESDNAYETPVTNRDITSIQNCTFVAMTRGECSSPRVNCAKSLFTQYNKESTFADVTSKIDQSIDCSENMTNNDIVIKYHKMLKYGIPTDAVRHKMNMDGVDTSMQEAVFTADNKTVYPSNRTNSINNLHSTGDITNNDMILKYQKMLKCGVPTDAVRHKMTMDGVDTVIQEAVFTLESVADQSQQSKNNVASVPESHRIKKLSPEDKNTSTQNSMATRKGVSMMLEAHMKKRHEESLPTKSNIASMLEGHLRKQLTIVNGTTVANQSNNMPPLNVEEEEIACKYRKMLKYGMPMDAVKHAMKRDQISEKIVSSVTTEDDIIFQTDKTEDLRKKEDERVLSKFKKMLSLNCPHDAVRNKMMLEGVDSALIEELFGPEQASNEGQPSTQLNAFTTEEEAIVEKYKKMSKVGIPQDAIRHAMIKENVNQSIIDKFLGTGQTESKERVGTKKLNEEEEVKVKEFKKMLKLGLPLGAVRHKMMMDNVSEIIMSTVLNNERQDSTTSPSGLTKRKQSGLINIYWEKLPTDKVENQQSVWSRSAKKARHDKNIDIDLDTLQELFKKQPKNNAHTSKTINKSNGSKKAQILDNQRTQNVSISLQAFKQFSVDELVQLINDIDPSNKIKGDRVSFLSGLLPKKEESDAIRRFKGDDKELSQVELFFRKLLTVTRVESKIKVIETMELFQQNFDEIFTRFNTLSTTCNQVMESEKLQLVLESVLAIGNIMNEGTRSGDAVGIKFDSLLKLTQTKSKDKKMSVLDYIVMMFIEKNERDVLKFSDDFPECVNASRMLITDIVSNFTSLESSLKTCKTELSKMKSEQLSLGLPFSPGLLRLEKFMGSSDNALTRLQLSRRNASKACKDLAAYCSEDGGERAATHVLEILTEFTRNIDDAIINYDNRKEQEARKEAREKKAAEKGKTKEIPGHNVFQTPSNVKKITTSSAEENQIQSGAEILRINVSQDLRGNNETVLESIGNLKSNVTTRPQDTRKKLHQDIEELDIQNVNISGKKEVNQQNEQDKVEKLDPRQALLQSIVKRQKPSSGDIGPKQTKSQNVKISGKKEVNQQNEQDKVEILDPRQALLQSIVKRQNPSSNEHIDSKPVHSRQALLQSIAQRPRVEPKSSDKASPNKDESPSVKSIMTSSRSLACGIVPDWEVAIPKFHPS